MKITYEIDVTSAGVYAPAVVRVAEVLEWAAQTLRVEGDGGEVVSTLGYEYVTPNAKMRLVGIEP